MAHILAGQVRARMHLSEHQRRERTQSQIERIGRAGGTYPAMRLLALLALFCALAPTLALAASPEGTMVAQAHATDEAANCRAKHGANYPAGYCSTPTPTPTTPARGAPAMDTPTPTPVLASAKPQDTPTPGPCWWTDHDLGDPDSGYIVFDEDGAPIPCPTEISEATETPTEQPTAAPLPAPLPPPAIHQPAAQQPPAQPARIYPTASATPTITPTATAARTRTATAMATAMRTPTPVPPTAIPTVEPTGTPLPAAAADPPPRIPFDWTGVLIVLGVLGSAGGIAAFMYVRLRRQHYAELADLEARS